MYLNMHLTLTTNLPRANVDKGLLKARNVSKINGKAE